MSRYDDAPETAESELRQPSDESIRVEDDLDNARRTYDDFEQQLLDAKTDDEKSHLEGVLQVVEREIEGLEQDLKEAEDELSRKNDYWFGEA